MNDYQLLSLKKPRLDTLTDYLVQVLLPRFDVVLSYDLGAGIRVERGKEIFGEWSDGDTPLGPLTAVRYLNRYLVFARNLRAVGAEKIPQVALIIKGAYLVCPAHSKCALRPRKQLKAPSFPKGLKFRRHLPTTITFGRSQLTKLPPELMIHDVFTKCKSVSYGSNDSDLVEETHKETIE